MNIFFATISVVVLTILLLLFYARREAKKHGTSAAEEVAGICSVVLERNSEKEKRKSVALQLLKDRGELGNLEIREHLGVSRRSAANYMTELEREGKVVQVGEVGRGVIYRIK